MAPKREKTELFEDSQDQLIDLNSHSFVVIAGVVATRRFFVKGRKRMITVKVKLNSALGQEIGQTEIEVSLPENSSIMDLVHEISRLFGDRVDKILFDSKRRSLKFVSFVNRSRRLTDQILNDGDQVRFLLPTGGG
jgi:molybdopterin converting factor small subunit